MEAIYAIDSKYGLSKEGNIPWKSKRDMIFFKNKTKYNIVIMERNIHFYKKIIKYLLLEENKFMKNLFHFVNIFG